MPTYHPLNAWASVISGLMTIVLELYIDNDRPKRIGRLRISPGYILFLTICSHLQSPRP